MPSLLDLLLAPFRRADEELSPEAIAKVEAALETVRAKARRCVRLVAGESSRSWLGGAPALPDGYRWPESDAVPLSFLAQIDLADVAAAGGPDWLPKDGTLLFFYEGQDLGPTSDDWKVVHFTATTALTPSPFPSDLPKTLQLASYPVGFEAVLSLPGFERIDDIVPGLSENESEEIRARLSWEYDHGDPNHQIGGYPDSIQGDHMEWECQLVTNGISVDSYKVYATPEAQRLKPDADEWQLLLQLDSDERMNVEWADGGRLYFWIRHADARNGDFSQVHMTIQFY